MELLVPSFAPWRAGGFPRMRHPEPEVALARPATCLSDAGWGRQTALQGSSKRFAQEPPAHTADLR